MNYRKIYRKLSIALIVCLLGVFLSGIMIQTRADYYDWEGNYHADNGYVYSAYGYYDPYGNFYGYSTTIESETSEDGLSAVDPYGFYKYVPIFYKADVNEELVGARKADVPVSWVGQNPELPNGCEATATTTVLNYYGFSVDKVTMATKYFLQPEKQIDFRYYYVGDPSDIMGLGCYSDAVVNAANEYLATQDTKLCAFSYQNYPFESLLNEVAKGFPVIIWASMYMYEPFYGIRINVDGSDLVWISQEHCLVLCGYDLDKKTVTVSDPLVGITQYDMNLFKKRFTQLRYNAVIIKTQEQQYEEEKNIVNLPFNDQLLPADKIVRGSRGFDGISGKVHLDKLSARVTMPLALKQNKK